MIPIPKTFRPCPTLAVAEGLAQQMANQTDRPWTVIFRAGQWEVWPSRAILDIPKGTSFQLHHTFSAQKAPTAPVLPEVEAGVDWLCQCGNGRLGVQEALVPDFCPACGHPIAAQQEEV